MGHKVSVVRGVKSDHFYNQQNGINEIWVGDVEVISRLPFGDSDQEQSSWPPGGVPKIPWHHFIIPLHKRDDLGNMASQNTSGEYSTCACDQSLPTTGYPGMYSGLHPYLAELLGYCFLGVAAALLLDFALRSERFLRLHGALTSSKEKKDEKEQLPLSDPSVTQACYALDTNGIIRELRSLCKWCAFDLTLVILCGIMGVPAFAAGSGNAGAAHYIMFKAAPSIVVIIGVIVIGFFIMVGKLVYLTRMLNAKAGRFIFVRLRDVMVLLPWTRMSEQTQSV